MHDISWPQHNGHLIFPWSFGHFDIWTWVPSSSLSKSFSNDSSHLPQVASKGNKHYKVYKITDKSKTNTYIKELSKEERIKEISLMLSGNRISTTAKAHAKQLLN